MEADLQQNEPKASLDAPIPLSFPSLLRNPGVSSRYAHLHSKPHSKAAPSDIPRIPKKTRRDENGGRRWVKRKENVQFVGNPHVVAPTRKDYLIQRPSTTATFPEPLPPYLPRSVKVPSRLAPELDAQSANAGRFSMSLKGMRRDLRRCGYRAKVLLGEIETEIMAWLDAGGTVVAPNLHEDTLESPGRPLGSIQTVFEVSRTPLQLVWDTADDSFARYVVHCCARFHNVVSFSKDVSGRRLTYLLRPNVTRPDHNDTIGLDTPPATDIDTSSQFASDSDVHSDLDSPSDLAESDHECEAPHRHLSTITETSAWSVVGDGDESENDGGLAGGIASLTIFTTRRSTRPQSGTRPARTLHNLISSS